MDRKYIIALVESEIRRKKAIAEVSNFGAELHLDVAEALSETLKAYKENTKNETD